MLLPFDLDNCWVLPRRDLYGNLAYESPTPEYIYRDTPSISLFCFGHAIQAVIKLIYT